MPEGQRKMSIAGLSWQEIREQRAWEQSERAKQQLDQLRAQTNAQKEPPQDATDHGGGTNEP